MASIDILLAVMAALVAACFTGYSLSGYSLSDDPRTTSPDNH
jgi:hypothetical protein